MDLNGAAIKNRSKKAIAVLISLFLGSQAFLVSSAEANFWKERRNFKQYAYLNPNIEIRNPKQFLNSNDLISKTIVSDLPFRSFGIVSDFDIRISNLLPFGTIRKLNLSHKGKNERIVLHFQDIHDNPEAQKNLASALQALIDQNQIGLLALEGAFGPMDLSGVRSFPHPKTVKVVADYLLREKRISGPAYTALTSAKPIPPIIGVDDKTHYQANIKAFQEAYRLAPTYKKRLVSVEGKLEQKKRRKFNPALRSFDQQVEAYRKDQMPLGDYVRVLAVREKAPLSTSIEVFLEALRLESSLDFDRAAAEREKLLVDLVKRLSDQESHQLVEASTAFRLGQINHGNFYQHVQNLCARRGLPLSRFPAMNSYIQYVLLADSINAEKLFADIKKLEEERYSRLVTTEEEQALVQESAYLHLIAKLVEFSLTKEEWNEYKAIRNSYSPPLVGGGRGRGLVSSSLKNSRNANLYPLPTLSHKGRGILPLAPFESFYQQAELRDRAMMANLINAMDQHNAKVAVLVTGGFHTHGINQLAKQNNLTTLTFSPKITKVDTDSGSAYLSVFAQEKTPLDRLFEGEKLFLAKSPFINRTVMRMLNTLADQKVDKNPVPFGSSMMEIGLSGRVVQNEGSRVLAEIGKDELEMEFEGEEKLTKVAVTPARLSLEDRFRRFYQRFVFPAESLFIVALPFMFLFWSLGFADGRVKPFFVLLAVVVLVMWNRKIVPGFIGLHRLNEKERTFGTKLINSASVLFIVSFLAGYSILKLYGLTQGTNFISALLPAAFVLLFIHGVNDWLRQIKDADPRAPPVFVHRLAEFVEPFLQYITRSRLGKIQLALIQLPPLTAPNHVETTSEQAMPDYQFINYANEMIAEGHMPDRFTYLRDLRVERLLESLNEMVHPLNENLRQRDRDFRHELRAADDEVDYEEFFDYGTEILKKAGNKSTLNVAFSGTRGGGKERIAKRFGQDLKKSDDFKNYDIRILSVSRFRRDKREPVDKLGEYDLPYLSVAARQLSNNERALIPIFDEKTGSQLYFKDIGSGYVRVINGESSFNVELIGTDAFAIIHPNEKGSFTKRSVHQLSVDFISGDTRVRVARNRNGNLDIRFGDVDFQIKPIGKNSFKLEMQGKETIDLPYYTEVQAYEIIDPLGMDEAQSNVGGRIVIWIGSPTLMFDDRQVELSANVNASHAYRVRRLILDRLVRTSDKGQTITDARRNPDSFERQLDYLHQRQFTDDRNTDEANRKVQSRRRFNPRTGQGNHFQLGGLSLAERAHRRHKSSDGLLAQSIITYFKGKGVDLVNMVLALNDLTIDVLFDWLNQVRAQHFEYGFTHPHPIGEPAMSREAAVRRYWKDDYVTLALGPLLLLKFFAQFPLKDKPDGSGKFIDETDGRGYQKPEDKAYLEHILERGNGFYVPSQLVNATYAMHGKFKYQYIGETYEQDKTREVWLEEILLQRQLPYIGAELNSLIEKLADNPAQFENVRAAGRVILASGFKNQRRGWDVGVLDPSANIVERYGIDIVGGKPTVLCVAPGGLKFKDVRDDPLPQGHPLKGLDALETVRYIAGQHKLPVHERDPRLPKEDTAIFAKYNSLKGYIDLTGYQRQYVYDIIRGRDLLESVPALFREDYIQFILDNVPMDEKGFNHLGFGQKWDQADEEAKRSLRNRRISTVVIDDTEVGFIESYFAEDTLEQLSRDFPQAFASNKPRPDTPQLAWAGRFVDLLPQDSDNGLYRMSLVFLRRLAQNPKWLEGFGSNGTAVAAIVDDIKKQVDAQQQADPFVRKQWEEALFYEFVARALEYGSSWESYDQRAARGKGVVETPPLTTIEDLYHEELGRRYRSGQMPIPAQLGFQGKPSRDYLRRHPNFIDLDPTSGWAEQHRDLLREYDEETLKRFSAAKDEDDRGGLGEKYMALIMGAGESSRMGKGMIAKLVLEALHDDPHQFIDKEKLDDAERAKIGSVGFETYIRSLVGQARGEGVDPAQAEEAAEKLKGFLYAPKLLAPCAKVNGRWYNFLAFNLLNIKKANDELEEKGYGRRFVPSLMLSEKYQKVIRDHLEEVAKRDGDGWYGFAPEEIIIFNQPLGYVLGATEADVQKLIDDEMKQFRLGKLTLDKLTFKTTFEQRRALQFAREHAGEVFDWLGPKANGHGWVWPALLLKTGGLKEPPIVTMRRMGIRGEVILKNLDNMALVDQSLLTVMGLKKKRNLFATFEVSPPTEAERGKGGGFAIAQVNGEEIIYQAEWDVAAESARVAGYNTSDKQRFPLDSPMNNATMGVNVEDGFDEFSDGKFKKAMAMVGEERDQALAGLVPEVTTKMGVTPLVRFEKVPAKARVSPEIPEYVGRVQPELRAWEYQRGRLKAVGGALTASMESYRSDLDRQNDPENGVRFNSLKEQGIYDVPYMQNVRTALTRRVVDSQFRLFKGIPSKQELDSRLAAKGKPFNAFHHLEAFGLGLVVSIFLGGVTVAAMLDKLALPFGGLIWVTLVVGSYAALTTLLLLYASGISFPALQYHKTTYLDSKDVWALDRVNRWKHWYGADVKYEEGLSGGWLAYTLGHEVTIQSSLVTMQKGHGSFVDFVRRRLLLPLVLDRERERLEGRNSLRWFFFFPYFVVRAYWTFYDLPPVPNPLPIEQSHQSAHWTPKGSTFEFREIRTADDLLRAYEAAKNQNYALALDLPPVFTPYQISFDRPFRAYFFPHEMDAADFSGGLPAAMGEMFERQVRAGVVRESENGVEWNPYYKNGNTIITVVYLKGLLKPRVYYGLAPRIAPHRVKARITLNVKRLARPNAAGTPSRHPDLAQSPFSPAQLEKDFARVGLRWQGPNYKWNVSGNPYPLAHPMEKRHFTISRVDEVDQYHMKEPESIHDILNFAAEWAGHVPHQETGRQLAQLTADAVSHITGNRHTFNVVAVPKSQSGPQRVAAINGWWEGEAHSGASQFWAHAQLMETDVLVQGLPRQSQGEIGGFKVSTVQPSWRIQISGLDIYLTKRWFNYPLMGVARFIEAALNFILGLGEPRIQFVHEASMGLVIEAPDMEVFIFDRPPGTAVPSQTSQYGQIVNRGIKTDSLKWVWKREGLRRLLGRLGVLSLLVRLGLLPVRFSNPMGWSELSATRLVVHPGELLNLTDAQQAEYELLNTAEERAAWLTNKLESGEVKVDNVDPTLYAQSVVAGYQAVAPYEKQIGTIDELRGLYRLGMEGRFRYIEIAQVFQDEIGVWPKVRGAGRMDAHGNLLIGPEDAFELKDVYNCTFVVPQNGARIKASNLNGMIVADNGEGIRLAVDRAEAEKINKHHKKKKIKSIGHDHERQDLLVGYEPELRYLAVRGEDGNPRKELRNDLTFRRLIRPFDLQPPYSATLPNDQVRILNSPREEPELFVVEGLQTDGAQEEEMERQLEEVAPLKTWANRRLGILTGLAIAAFSESSGGFLLAGVVIGFFLARESHEYTHKVAFQLNGRDVEWVANKNEIGYRPMDGQGVSSFEAGLAPIAGLGIALALFSAGLFIPAGSSADFIYGLEIMFAVINLLALVAGDGTIIRTRLFEGLRAQALARKVVRLEKNLESQSRDGSRTDVIAWGILEDISSRSSSLGLRFGSNWLDAETAAALASQIEAVVETKNFHARHWGWSLIETTADAARRTGSSSENTEAGFEKALEQANNSVIHFSVGQDERNVNSRLVELQNKVQLLEAYQRKNPTRQYSLIVSIHGDNAQDQNRLKQRVEAQLGKSILDWAAINVGSSHIDAETQLIVLNNVLEEVNKAQAIQDVLAGQEGSQLITLAEHPAEFIALGRLRLVWFILNAIGERSVMLTPDHIHTMLKAARLPEHMA